MDSNKVEWLETVPNEVYEFVNRLYENYTEIVTGKPMDKPDFNGCIYMLAFYDMYIKQVEAGEIQETDLLPLDLAKTNFLNYSKEIHYKEILY